MAKEKSDTEIVHPVIMPCSKWCQAGGADREERDTHMKERRGRRKIGEREEGGERGEKEEREEKEEKRVTEEGSKDTALFGFESESLPRKRHIFNFYTLRLNYLQTPRSSKKMSSMEMEVCGEDTVLGELQKYLKDLFNDQLSDFNMQVKLAKLELLHRGSFHLQLRPQQQDAGELPVVDPRSMKLALEQAQTHVKLLLALMDLLLEEICHCRHLLQSFLLQCENHVGLNHVGLDQEQLSSTLTVLRHLQQHLDDFNQRDQLNLGPFHLDNQLAVPTESPRQVEISASLIYKLPVVFDRLRCVAKATAVQLFWAVAGGETPEEEPLQFYEVQIKALHPSVDEHGPYEQYAVQGMHLCVEPLLPERCYQFTVKRLDGTGLVLRDWTDEMTMTTTSL